MRIITARTIDKRWKKIISQTKEFGFPHVADAINNSAREIMKYWKDKVKGSDSKRPWRSGYINALHIVSVGDNLPNGRFKKDKMAAIITAENAGRNSALAHLAEEDQKEWDMKPGLLKGRQSRVILMKKKASYFPDEVKAEAKTLESRQALKGYRDQFKRKESWKYGEYYKLTQLGSKGSQSSYGTFRTVTVNSTGWIYPASTGIHVFDSVCDWASTRFQRNVQVALGEDIKELKKVIREVK